MKVVLFERLPLASNIGVLTLDCMRRYFVLFAVDAILGACHTAEMPAPGYAILSRAIPSVGLRPGDSLAELTRSELPVAVGKVAKHPTDSLQYPADCLRAFTRHDANLLLAEPFCGREPDFTDTSSDYAKVAATIVVDRDGRLRRAPTDGWLDFRMLCPAKRRPDGRVYPKHPHRIDECERWTLSAPDSLFTEGLSTPFGVILPQAVTSGLLDQCSRDVPPSAEAEWTPRLEQIAELERGLPAYLSQSGHGQMPVRLEQYGRQYGGYVVGGDSLIYVNAFLRLPDLNLARDWLRRPVMVCDGGMAFFGLSYDARRRRFFGLAFNGIA